ncbi:V-type sodium ATPase subunit C [bacterium HR07]|uniref:V-type H+-transporting ATPase subunit C n=2 Tax=Candidatus Bipolaricaulota TaxID=67810 RepID=H5SB35_9BACT|nr:V-type H+-transporting ATPase subunit C [uncultured Acetothermia bacterium]BAL59644.1 V-type H+-transporting ATPase subunit C [Candidatus Acetothermum autotrophicum]GBC76202.1 V-type sodium ATPase subunit C [bacterium HR07]
MVVDLLETRFEQEGAYAFATGRIRALEAKLLNRTHYQRLLEAPDALEAWRALAEMGYAKAAERKLEDYEEVLTGELRDLYALLTALSPEPERTLWLQRRYDFHHLKVYLKAKLLGEDPSESVLDGVGTIAPKLVEVSVNTGVWGELFPELAHTGERALRAYESTRHAQTIDTVVDQGLFAYLQAATAGHPFAETLVAIWADLLNLKSLARVKLMEKDRAFASRVLVPGGSLEDSRLLALMDAAIETWADELRSTPYSSVLSRGLAQVAEKRSLALLEKLSDDFVMEFLKRAKLALYGAEPLIAYVLAKETELKNIRIILVGKLNGLSRETLEEHLREPYV